MAELSLTDLVRRGLATGLVGDGSVRVRGIRHDSRHVQPGDLFAALPGVKRHGTEFVQDAVTNGASAVLAEHALEASVPVVIAHDALAALSAIACVLYDDPTAALSVVGITGTNGKTTTAYLVEAILQHAGMRPAVIGTINVRGPGGARPTLHTTPMADDLMRHARWAVDTGATHLVLEVSSHALAMRRADAVRFAVAAFTNLTQDHLDYHGDMSAYARAKRRLFFELAPAVSVINVDDAEGARIADELTSSVLRCSCDRSRGAEITVSEVELSAQGISAKLHTHAGKAMLSSPLVGRHNLENLLVAIGVGLSLSLPLTDIVAALATAVGAPGRLERVSVRPGHEPVVLVDYAHTPDALVRVLDALRPLTKGRLIVAFGCGGDRDRKKRPQMGRAAGARADVCIVTSDNPRTEPPQQILDEIVPGLLDETVPAVAADALASAARGYHVQGDRRAAIELAVRAAGVQDVVLIAGKGHETEQIIGTRREHFDDREQARAALLARAARQERA